MARFDVSEHRPGAFSIDVQSDFVPFGSTRVVVPLLPFGELPPAGDLTPIVAVRDERFVMATHLLFSALTRQLGPPVANLAVHRDEITRALDLLCVGF